MKIKNTMLWPPTRFCIFSGLILLLNTSAWIYLKNHSTNNTGRIVAFSHAGETTSKRDALSWKFNVPMDESMCINPFRIVPAIRGVFSWNKSTLLTFTPTTDWPFCTTFEAILSPDLKTLNNEPVSGAQNFTFHSDELRILDASQINYSSAGKLRIKLDFNTRPDLAGFEDVLRLKSPGSNTQFPLHLKSGFHGNSLVFETRKIPEGLYRITCSKGLMPQRGTRGLLSDFVFDIQAQKQIVFTRIRSSSSLDSGTQIKAFFSCKPDLFKTASFIEIQPRTEFRVIPLHHYYNGGICVTGDFNPGQEYTLTFLKGMPAENGSKLKESVSRSIQIKNYPASIQIIPGGTYLSPYGELEIPIRSVNATELDVEIQQVFENNLVHLSSQLARDLSWNNSAVIRAQSELPEKKTYILSGRKNEATTTRVNLREFYTNPSGVFYVQARAGNKTVKRLVSVTDLGITAKRDKKGMLLRVNSLRSALPVQGATVSIYSYSNQKIGSAQTDANGLAYVQVPETATENQRPFAVTASRNQDLCLLNLHTSMLPAMDNAGGAPYLSDGVEAFIFSDRGVYRPGDSLHIKTVLRDAGQGSPAPFPIEFTIMQPDGQRCHKEIAMLSQNGSTELHWNLPADLQIGRYYASVCLPGSDTEIGNYSFAVEEFIPPQIRVEASIPTNRVTGGEMVSLAVAAHYLFGRAADQLAVSGGMNVTAAPFSSPEFTGYRFGDPEARFSTYERTFKPTVLNNEGTVEFSLNLPTDNPRYTPLRAILRASVTEPSGRSVSDYTSIIIDPCTYYLGMKSGKQVRSHQTNLVSMVAVKPNGSAAVITRVEATLHAVHWNSVLKNQPNGKYSYESVQELQLLEHRQLKLHNGKCGYAFVPPSAGEYLLRIVGPNGVHATTRFYASSYDNEWVSSSKERPDHIGLILDQASYRTGEVARLQITAPFTGSALLTVESDRILEQRVIELDTNSQEVDIPVRAEYAPNVYCSLSLIRPVVSEKIWSAHRATGTIPLSVELPEKELQVTFSIPDSIKPQTQLEFLIHVSDANGNPVANCELTVVAVDEAICMLTGFKTPDPLNFFMRKRKLSVKSFDLYSELMQLIDASEENHVSHTAGDAGFQLKGRINPIKTRRYIPLALWHEPLNTDSNGVAQATFSIPEFSGELRVMAVACTPSAVGAVSASTQVRRNVVLQTGLPRFLAPGDSCEMNLTIFNNTPSNQPVRVVFSEAGLLSATGSAFTTNLAGNATATFSTSLTAGRLPGVARCRFDLLNASQSSTQTINLPVRPASAAETVTVSGILAAGEQQTVQAPDGWMDGSIQSSISVNQQPTLKLGGALHALMDYPHGCLEQTTSKSFPLLYLPELANHTATNTIGQPEVDALVQAGIQRILGMQRTDGRFNYWPQSGQMYSWGSLYVTHFLVEACSAGYSVSDERMDAALKAVAKRLDQPVPHSSTDSFAWKNDQSERAYACHILAKAGTPNSSWNNRLKELAPSLPCDARLHLALALIHSNEMRDAFDLLEATTVPVTNPWKNHDPVLRSRVRDTALYLLAWLELSKEAPVIASSVETLYRSQTNGCWSSTQDNALALLALGKYAHNTPPDTRPYSGTIAGIESVEFSEAQPLHWHQTAGNPQTYAISNSGPGSCNFTASFTGIPINAGHQHDRHHGMNISSCLLDPDTGNELANQTLFKKGDLAIVRIQLDPFGQHLNGIVIEDLLPAGFEIENPRLKTSQRFKWIGKQDSWVIHQEMRDDRLLLFTADVSEKKTFHYAVRAVSGGRFTYPALSAECMYSPTVRSRSNRADIIIGNNP